MGRGSPWFERAHLRKGAVEYTSFHRPRRERAGGEEVNDVLEFELKDALERAMDFIEVCEKLDGAPDNDPFLWHDLNNLIARIEKEIKP